MHNLLHLLSNELLMGGLSIASCLHLSGGLLGESDAEHSDDVPVGGLGLREGLDGRVPLFDHGLSFVSGDVHSVEVSIAVISLDLFDLELELPPALWLGGVVAIGEGGGEHTALKTVGRVR